MWGVMVVVVALIAVVTLLFVWIAHTGRRVRERADYVLEASPLVQRRATVRSKNIQRLETGTIKMPDHRVCYTAMFQADDGQKVRLEVDELAFENLVEGMEDTLITQNDRFVGFGSIGSVDTKQVSNEQNHTVCGNQGNRQSVL